MKLSPHFVKTLEQRIQPIDPNKLYKCQNCHRPNLKPEFIHVLSAGEAYCKPCVKGA